MTDAPLPAFRYHPDAVATGSFRPASGPCPHCGVDRGYVYAGPIYGLVEPDPPCPACIADGSFAARFDATFTDDASIAGVDPAIVDEITTRTPGFESWQAEHWPIHCGDVAAFHGPAGYAELVERPEAMAALRVWLAEELEWQPAWIDEYLPRLSRDGGSTAYLFRCLHCDAELAVCDDD